MKANKKDTILRIRISTNDKAIVKDKAIKKQKTMSTYIRELLSNE